MGEDKTFYEKFREERLKLIPYTIEELIEFNFPDEDLHQLHALAFEITEPIFTLIWDKNNQVAYDEAMRLLPGYAEKVLDFLRPRLAQKLPHLTPVP